MRAPLRVLIVEDEENDAQLLVRELRRGGYELTYERVDTPQGMTAALERQWDIVISDWAMPHFSARAALALLQATKRDLPFIIVSGTVGEEAAVAAMHAGANDFMAKGRYSRLVPAIERELREAASRAQRRAIEQQLRQTQKMESMGRLTGGIAHDFNNLLGVIVASCDLMLDQVRSRPQEAELANEIMASALHGTELTHRLLAFARQQPLSLQVVELNAQLARAVTILQRTLGEGVSVQTNLSEGLWPAKLDPSQVEDAVLNLAINARDAMPGGGFVTIETANARLDGDYAARHPDVTPGDYVMLAVKDTGTGMPPEVAERALEPFFTTKELGKGTGLGLSMVYGFVRQSGGHIELDTAVGMGTTVRIYLPRAQREQVAAAPARVAEAAGGGEAILLVDDNEALRRVMVRRLANLGYHVRDAEDGMAALAVLAAGERFDLLFTDIGLPGRMDGFALAEEARRRRPGLKVLFTTGYGHVDAVTEPEHLIRKPFRSEELAAKLRAALA